ncbi:NrfD/PsrC family molybdoenzyme membrane anchor subunit [Singulisphaera acidiphila]|uniref:Polysulfide reductase n=1 Tax=Singulisphaera acidiphila (strain ATCC BAA-1392 / DSM 18658 / VKM B-2454 / MOB10) TaxID=886293 RepID=L0DF89_SINAD|nr:NrfD/PsrC family molybdoenzyme membrane anchor subunit [Singulisphaera acidiphila]AGA27912.1 polysulfide reductase [Singulisphaera acidiphila DSM 18658]
MASDRPENLEQDEHLVLAPGHTYASVTDKISSIVLTSPFRKSWIFGFALSFLLTLMLLTTITAVLTQGVGLFGIRRPVMWGFDIVNFVWWIGIGHAGTLISAVLLLFRQEWRTSINRFAEAMTLFAVACAGLYPLMHMGRPWYFYWLTPYPNTMALWPQWRSPLVWDVFAVSTYASVSLLFWYVGLIPDLATFRDRSKNRFSKIIYGILAMGWRGSAIHWHRYRTAYLLLAGIATPLVVSVHTVVSLDFAAGVVPGWHTTIFPPYFVAGAIYSGFAMVLTLAIPLRRYYGLEDFITMKHLENMAKILLVTGLIVSYGYALEAFFAWYSGNTFEQFMMKNRATGPYWHTYALLILCNCLSVQVLWSKWARTCVPLLWVLSIVINIGMWLERYVIVVTSLARDYIPGAWGMYHGSVWDYSMYYGTIGLFFALLFLFIRVLPVISIAEMRELVAETRERNGGEDHGSSHDDDDQDLVASSG